MNLLYLDPNLLFALACLFGLFMAWGIGANDVANAMGTSVGSKALTIKQAIIIAAIFEFAGAFLAGGAVTQTISKGIVDTADFIGTPELLVFGMLAALLAAAIWLALASFFGWPVSTTHSIIGAIVGFTIASKGVYAVHWGQIVSIVMSWVVSPVAGGVFAYLLFISVQKFIFNTSDPFKYAKRYIPYYIFLTGFVVTMVTLTKGLTHIGWHLTLLESIASAIIISIALMWIGQYRLQRLRPNGLGEHEAVFANVEKAFAILMAFTACAMAFAHGSNDVANAIGPIAAVISIVESGGNLEQTSVVTPWILAIGGIGIVLGLVMYGHRVIATVGSGITELTPSRGFAATLGAATTVLLASGTGLPISTTHTLVGAVLGVGLARGIGAINLNVVKTIIVSWIVTLPAGGILAIIFFYLLKITLT